MSSHHFGFINAFKPPGPSSASFGNWVKHIAGGAAVGHWGTLDPTACGVLLLAVGKATKLLPLLPHARKQYVFELIVGASTDTGDAMGTVVRTADVDENWAEALHAAAAALIGPQNQIPPMHSAVKIKGRPLYRSARAGLDIPRASRSAVVYDLHVISQATARVARLFVDCEAGMYVRVLCEELGRRLGVPAHMGALLRVASGPFLLRDSVYSQQISASLSSCLINPLTVLHNPRVELDEPSAYRFNHGNDVRLPSPASPNVEVLVTRGETLLGCGQVLARDGAHVLAPTRVLHEP